jgi:hypothetical protein
MCHGYLSLCFNTEYLESGQGLAMSVGLAVAFASFGMKNQDLPIFFLFDDPGFDFGSGNQGRTDPGLSVADHEDFVQLDRVSDLTVELFHFQ